MRLTTVVLFSLGVLSAACDPGTSRSDVDAASVTVRDSAGIRIVENHDSVWTDATRWRLADEPDFVIGSFDGSVPGTDFGDFVEARAFGDRVVIADGQTPGFRLFDRDGAWIATLGQRGDGPLELSDAAFAWQVIGADTLATWDLRGRKVVVFDTGSDEVSTYPTTEPPVEVDNFEMFGIGGWMVAGWLPDGSYILSSSPDPRARDPGRSLLAPEFHRMTPSGDYVGPIGEYAMRRVFIDPGGELVPLEFPTVGHFALEGTYAWHAFADSLFEFRRIDAIEGRVDMRVRIRREPLIVTERMTADARAATDAQMESVMDELGEMMPPGMREDMRTAVEEMRARQPEAGYAPAIFGLRPLSSGHVLVDLPDWEWRFDINAERLGGIPAAESAAWAVFDPDGHWLGTLEAPVGLTPTDVTDDYVIGYRKDQFEIPYVERWRIIRTGTPAP